MECKFLTDYVIECKRQIQSIENEMERTKDCENSYIIYNGGKFINFNREEELNKADSRLQYYNNNLATIERLIEEFKNSSINWLKFNNRSNYFTILDNGLQFVTNSMIKLGKSKVNVEITLISTSISESDLNFEYWEKLKNMIIEVNKKHIVKYLYLWRRYKKINLVSAIDKENKKLYIDDKILKLCSKGLGVEIAYNAYCNSLKLLHRYVDSREFEVILPENVKALLSL